MGITKKLKPRCGKCGHTENDHKHGYCKRVVQWFQAKRKCGCLRFYIS